MHDDFRVDVCATDYVVLASFILLMRFGPD